MRNLSEEERENLKFCLFIALVLLKYSMWKDMYISKAPYIWLFFSVFLCVSLCLCVFPNYNVSEAVQHVTCSRTISRNLMDSYTEGTYWTGQKEIYWTLLNKTWSHKNGLSYHTFYLSIILSHIFCTGHCSSVDQIFQLIEGSLVTCTCVFVK